MAAAQLALLREQHEQLRLAGLAEAKAKALVAEELAHARSDLAAAKEGEERWRGLLAGARSRAEHSQDLVHSSEAALLEANGALGEHGCTAVLSQLPQHGAVCAAVCAAVACPLAVLSRGSMCCAALAHAVL
jgi:hypothetical protein